MTCFVEDFFERLQASVSGALQSLKIGKARAEQAATSIAERVCRELGGQTLYIPRRLGSRLLKRDEEIFAKFLGDNTAELARMYELTERRIYSIIRKERRRRRGKAVASEAGSAPGQ